MHQRYGKLPWKDLFQSAIAYAEHGFPVTEAIQESWAEAATRIKRTNPSRCACSCPAASAPQDGDVFRNPDIGPRLRLARRAGPRRVLQRRDRRGDFQNFAWSRAARMTAEDLAGFSPEWVEPISIDYRGWRVYELPPNGQGMAALEMLNIMETTPASPLRARSAPRNAQAHRGDEAGLRRRPPL